MLVVSEFISSASRRLDEREVRNEWHRIQCSGAIRIYSGRRSLFTSSYNLQNHHEYMQRSRYNEVQALHFAQEILRRCRERQLELRERLVLDLDSDSDSDESDDDVDGGQLVADDYVNDFNGKYVQHAPAA